MTVLVEHDNSINGAHGFSEDTIATLEDLLPLIQNYIQAGSSVLDVLRLKQAGKFSKNFSYSKNNT